MEHITLEEVEQAYYDCRKHKRSKKSAIEYELNYELNNYQLWKDLNDGTYDISTCICFYVTRPKLREVFCADFRDRIVHHLIMRKFLWLFEQTMIDDSYNCREGKGVLYGIKRMRKHIEDVSKDYSEEAWALKFDLQGFFMSIDRDILWDMIEKSIKGGYQGEDAEWWLRLIHDVVFHRPELNCEVRGDVSLKDKIAKNKSLFHSEGRGLPIGNLTSQIFANFYLSAYDQWLKQWMRKNERYGRYVDDACIISNDKAHALRLLYMSRLWLKTMLHVNMHPDKMYLQEAKKGLPFIGYVIKPHRVYCGDRIVNSAFEAVREWNKHRNGNADKYAQRVNSYLGFMVHWATYGIRWNLWREIRYKDCVNINMRLIKTINKNDYYDSARRDYVSILRTRNARRRVYKNERL